MLRINRVDSCVLGVNLSWRGEPDSCGGLNLEHLGPEAHGWWCQPSQRACGRKKKGRQHSPVAGMPPIGAMAGGVFCGSTCDWKLPQRYFGERKEYNELMSAEISMGSTATTHGPSWTTYDTRANPISTLPPKQRSARPRFLPRVKPRHPGFLKGLYFDRKILDSYKQVNS